LAVEITSKRQLFEKEATMRPSPLVTVAAAAERLAVSRSLIRKLLKKGRLTPVRIGRCVRVRIDELDALLAGDTE
jgi:excisionase family DNA binding protein